MSTGRAVPWSELAKNNGKNGVWYTAINGAVYDISALINKHPGGEIIRLAAGRDATSLYESYHPGDKAARVRAVLEKHPLIGHLVDDSKDKASPTPYQAADGRFFVTVRDRVEAHLKSIGMDRHHVEWMSMFETTVTALLYLVCTYFTSMYGSYLAAVFVGILTARLGFIMHTGNHRGTSKSQWRNYIAGCMMDLAGSSHINWAHEHQVAHHMDPNEVGKDNDCSIGDPTLRLHPDVKYTGTWTQRWQHVLTPIGMSSGFFKWYIVDFFNMWEGRVGSVRFSVTLADWIHLIVFKGFWFVCHVVIPVYNFGLFSHRTWGPLFVFMIVGAQYLEETFIVNHIQGELAHPPPEMHWAGKQVIATANWGSRSVFWNWVSGGLNHQVEHHLFPSISIYCYPHISRVVEQTCKEFGLPYHNYPSYFSAWWAMISYLKLLGTGATPSAPVTYKATAVIGNGKNKNA